MHGELDELSLYKAMIMAKDIDMSLEDFFTPLEQASDSELKAKSLIQKTFGSTAPGTTVI